MRTKVLVMSTSPTVDVVSIDSENESKRLDNLKLQAAKHHFRYDVYSKPIFGKSRREYSIEVILNL